MAVGYPLFPLSFVRTAIGIFADSKTVWLPHVPQTVKAGPIWQILNALSMEDAILPLSFVHLSIFPLVDTLATRLVVLVRTREAATVDVDTFSRPLPLAVSELALIVIAAGPDHSTDTMRDLCTDLALVAKATIEDQSVLLL